MLNEVFTFNITYNWYTLCTLEYEILDSQYVQVMLAYVFMCISQSSLTITPLIHFSVICYFLLSFVEP